MNHAKCPFCDHEISDVHNGGDPRTWWNSENIPDGYFKHECASCNAWFKVSVNWSPFFECEEIDEDELDELQEV